MSTSWGSTYDGRIQPPQPGIEPQPGIRTYSEGMGPPKHLLEELVLPDRYEALRDHLGPDLVRLLVAPPDSVEDAVVAVAESVLSKRRGILLPAWGPSGTGKSTLSHTLDHFFAARFAPAVAHNGAVSDEALHATVVSALKSLAPTDTRVIPLVIDGREGELPSDGELAAVKRFLRTEGGSRTVLLWLETSEDRAKRLGSHYEEIAGAAPIELPMTIEGPPTDTWRGLARTTLQLANQVSDLEALGVDPANYSPSDYRTVGDYLSAISEDFNARKIQMLRDLQKPTQLVIAFASESREVGPVAQFTEGRRLGLLNAHALVAATPGTEVGRWWDERMGLLTSTIVRMNVRAYVMPPTLSVTALRRSGGEQVRSFLADDGIVDVDPSPYWQRSDIGRFLIGEERDTPETRGNPSKTKTMAFARLGEEGYFSSNQDRALNKGIGRSLQTFLDGAGLDDATVEVERQLATPARGLGEGDVIPDILVDLPNLRTGIEVTWRQGDWVLPKNRAAMAEYILKKLRGYALALGWAS